MPTGVFRSWEVRTRPSVAAHSRMAESEAVRWPASCTWIRSSVGPLLLAQLVEPLLRQHRIRGVTVLAEQRGQALGCGLLALLVHAGLVGRLQQLEGDLMFPGLVGDGQPGELLGDRSGELAGLVVFVFAGVLDGGAQLLDAIGLGGVHA